MPKIRMRKVFMRELSNETPVQESVLQMQSKIVLNADMDDIAFLPTEKNAKVKWILFWSVTSRQPESESFNGVVPAQATVEYAFVASPSKKPLEIEPMLLQKVCQLTYNLDGRNSQRITCYMVHTNTRPIVLNCFWQMNAWAIIRMPCDFDEHTIRRRSLKISLDELSLIPGNT